MRRDRLAAMEGPAQERWRTDRIFEAKAEFNEDGSAKEKFMVTFPYPYMNGRLHLGHAYSMSKVHHHALNSECFESLLSTDLFLSRSLARADRRRITDASFEAAVCKADACV